MEIADCPTAENMVKYSCPAAELSACLKWNIGEWRHNSTQL